MKTYKQTQSVPPIPLVGLVTEGAKYTASNGTFYWRISLKTKNTNIRCIIWDAALDAESSPDYPHTGELISVANYKDQTAEKGSVIINKAGFSKIEKDELAPEERCVLEPDKAPAQDMKYAWSLITDNSFWNDKKNHAFTMAVIDSYGVDKFKMSPAATSVHHNYQGGLLVHTAEVLDLCRAYVDVTFKKYDFINKDVLYSGAILHDIGKIETYSFNDFGMATSTGVERMHSHIFYGMMSVIEVARKLKMSLEFANEVAHCVAAHHGCKDWGSFVDIQSLEAGVISSMDYLSSKNGKMEKALKEVNPQSMPSDIKLYKETYFLSSGIKACFQEEQQ